MFFPDPFVANAYQDPSSARKRNGSGKLSRMTGFWKVAPDAADVPDTGVPAAGVPGVVVPAAGVPPPGVPGPGVTVSPALMGGGTPFIAGEVGGTGGGVGDAPLGVGVDVGVLVGVVVGVAGVAVPGPAVGVGVELGLGGGAVSGSVSPRSPTGTPVHAATSKRASMSKSKRAGSGLIILFRSYPLIPVVATDCTT
jgi:hypothetical protein